MSVQGVKCRVCEAMILPWVKGNRAWCVGCILGVIFVCWILMLAGLFAITFMIDRQRAMAGLLGFPLVLFLGVPLVITAIFELVFCAIYMPIGRKMDRLREEAKSKCSAALQDDCLLVKDVIQQPGIIQMADEHLIFTPLLGKPFVVPLDSIRDLKESNWASHPLHLGQKGFMFSSSEVLWRAGFITPNAEQWRPYLDR